MSIYLNEFDGTMKHIQGKWKIVILYELFERKIMRFNEIKKYIETISHKTLTNQLKEMELDGLILKKIYPVMPPCVEYKLTEKGESIIPLLEEICNWGLKNISEENFEKKLCNDCNENSLNKTDDVEEI